MHSSTLIGERAFPWQAGLSATREEMISWGRGVISSRNPDFIIGDNYLRRWWIIPRNEQQNVYLHEINKSDDDRALHDHPWDNVSLVIDGEYTEVTPEGSFLRVAGDIVHRSAETLHRLEIAPGSSALSLFFTGPKIREWGFACPKGWRYYKDFCATDNVGQVGRGCD